ncbi:MAG: glycosyl hydrolase [Bryobacterales bacterium]|nr:glycosyl hydrolase [Bryobacterales bacterium]
MKIDYSLEPRQLKAKIDRLWDASAAKIRSLEAAYEPARGTPVFTVRGVYTSRGWTEWTQGFQFGSAILQFDATGEREFLEAGRKRTVALMASHVSHTGVHDHGFNNVSTYGNLLRLARDGRIDASEWEQNFYRMALQASGAVQARRWSAIRGGGGYIYSFNGPHSLFVDTIRSLRSLGVAHLLGHLLMDEGDRRISLLDRLIQHARATADYSVYYGEGRDAYDVRGRTAHESVFNVNDGNYRCPNSQQGYSPFSTWTRGLAWAMLGFPEQLEFIETLDDGALEACGGRSSIEGFLRKAALATCDFYIDNSAADGIPYWDTGAPGLARMGNYRNRPAEPFNEHEPVDSSAAAIGAQGLLRLGRYLEKHGDADQAKRYWQAGLTVLDNLFDEPYLSTDSQHQGLILHSVYHRPNGWDHVPEGRKVPCGETSMRGDYHAREVAQYLGRVIDGAKYYTFF